MATNTCTDCGCKKCGCTDKGLITPIACPTPIGCPTPEPCSEVINAECVVYTGLDIECDDDIVVETDTTLADALVDIVTYFCDNGGGGPAGPTGPTGPAGPGGTTGATGPQGAQGIPGPVGPAGLNWQGSWSALGVYAPDDAVGYAGASWFCLNAVGPSPSNPTIDPTNWALLASEGAVGPQGPIGPAGAAGATGATGATGGSIFIYEIGQYVAAESGVVFHRWLSTTPFGTPQAGTTQNYLIIDLTDLSTGAAWSTLALNISNVESTNNGSANTATLIAAGAPAGITTGTAAVLCDSSTNGGKTDWYLPAIDELSKLFTNRWEVAAGLSVAGGTQLAYNFYWSSTEYDNFYAWNLHFTSGILQQNNYIKLNPILFVRAVRRLSI